VALVTTAGAVTYADFNARVQRMTQGLVARLAGNRYKVALAVKPTLACVEAFFAALSARCLVLILDPDAPEGTLAEQIRRFAPDLLIVDEGSRSKVEALRGAMGIASGPELLAGETKEGAEKGPLDLREPAVALPAKEGLLAFHSHYSLIAGAVSWATFMGMTAKDVSLVLLPLHTWEGLYAVLVPLFLGGSALLGDWEDPDPLVDLIEGGRPTYVLLNEGQALEMARRPWRPFTEALAGSLRWGFVSVQGLFKARHRKRLRDLLRKPILTLYGLAETGLALASHPNWYIDEAVGLPLTNVELRPANPETGLKIEVPWEMLEYAEISVKSPLLMHGYDSPPATEAKLQEGWFLTGDLASMDANGLFYFLER